ncbi:hypothetical protein [Lentzea sp. CA-135723]|uniref:hypothetical protein n=1 Tax=Lentzea sp. CA-135723 TaxID=3239950 RepID=UPI003D8D4209
MTTGLVLGAGSAAAAPHTIASTDARARYVENFDSLDTAIWQCEYTCPAVVDGVARFELRAGVPPRTAGSWSKIRYKPQRFTSGRFTTRFALSHRPKQKVWWGSALWSDGPAADGSQFNEINFGYTTDQSYTNTQLRFESARRGKAVSLKVDTGVDLYDGRYHTATLQYSSSSVDLYFDGRLLMKITDPSVIPADPMSFVLGPRLVAGAPLSGDFTQTVGAAEIG